MPMNKAVEAELNRLYESNGDLLEAKSVVEWAKKNPKSALHKCFEWDNVKAGDAYRLQQARALIMEVVIIPQQMDTPTRQWVSIRRDRYQGGGYRRIDEVLDDEVLTNMMLLEALEEARRWSFKYQHITRLARIHKTIAAEADKIEPELMSKEQLAALHEKREKQQHRHTQ